MVRALERKDVERSKNLDQLIHVKERVRKDTWYCERLLLERQGEDPTNSLGAVGDA